MFLSVSCSVYRGDMNKIKFKDYTTMLVCKDVPASVEFYKNILGFEIINKDDDIGKSGWAVLRNGNIDIMLASPAFLPEPAKVEKSTRNVSITFTQKTLIYSISM